VSVDKTPEGNTKRQLSATVAADGTFRVPFQP